MRMACWPFLLVSTVHFGRGCNVLTEIFHEEKIYCICNVANLLPNIKIKNVGLCLNLPIKKDIHLCIHFALTSKECKLAPHMCNYFFFMWFPFTTILCILCVYTDYQI